MKRIAIGLALTVFVAAGWFVFQERGAREHDGSPGQTEPTSGASAQASSAPTPAPEAPSVAALAATTAPSVASAADTISGRVQWPDGTPARADVQAEREEPDGGPSWWMCSAGGRADGSFRIQGLAGSRFHVVARAARPESGATGAARTAGRKQELESWCAEATGVENGAHDLVLTLARGLALRGAALDDLGARLGEFSVRATPFDGNEYPDERAHPVIRRFVATDGSFELTGLTSGDWNLSASAEGHSDPAPVRVTVPASAPVQLVVPRGARVSGLVLDAAGSPIARARVRAQRDRRERMAGIDAGRSALADAQGTFTFTGLDVGHTTLTAEMLGFVPGDPLELALDPGQEVHDLVLRLRAGGTIAGEVLGAGERAEVGLQVDVSGGDRSSFLRALRTGPGGRFELLGVPAGDYELATRVSGGALLAAAVTVREGESVDVHLAPPGAEFTVLHGRITAGGKALSADISARSGNMESSGRSNATGAYELTLLAEGPHEFSLSTRVGNGRFSWSTSLDVPRVSELEHDFDVPLGEISGRVTDEDGQPLAGIMVRGRAEDRHDSGLDVSARSDADGRYAFVVAPGRYAVEAGGLADSGAEVHAHVSVNDLLVTEEARLDGIDLVLARGGVLAGRVLLADGTAADGAAILSLGGLRADGSRTTRTLGWADETGRFRLDGLARGTLLIGAMQQKSALLRKPVRVALEAGVTRTLELTLAPATVAHVLVHDAGGAQVSAGLQLTDEGGVAWPVNSNGAGEAWPGPLPAGRYTLRALGKGERHAQHTFELRGDEPELGVELTLVLE